jgi:oligosaccharide repeat unit polymerase
MTIVRSHRLNHANPPDVLSGLCLILAGMTGAIFAVPQDVQDPTALVSASICMGLGLLIPAALRLQGDTTKVLRAENMLLVGIFYWLLLDLLQSAYPYYGVDRSDIVTAFLATGIFAAAIWLGAAGRGWQLPTIIRAASERSFSSNTIFVAIIISFVLGILDFAISSGFDLITMVNGAMAARFSAPWSRGQFGGSDAFLNFLQYFGYILPALCLLLARREAWWQPRVLFAVLLTAVMLLFLAQPGGRRVIGVVVGSALVTVLVDEQRLKLKTIFLAGLAAAMLLAFLDAMLRYRNFGFAALANDSAELDPTRLHVDDNFLRLSQIIAIFPDFHPYVFFKPIYHALTLPIPRIFWSSKPTDIGYDLAQLVGEKGVSLSSSIIGELYASFGLSAVFIGGLFFGRLAGMWNRCLEVRGRNGSALMYGMGVMVMFAGMRSLQALIEMSYMLLAWIAISAILGQRGRGASGRL